MDFTNHPSDPTRHEEVLRCLFRESNDAFFLFEPQSLRVIDLNPAALRLTAYDRKQALQLRVTELFDSEDPKAVDRLIEAYRKTHIFHSREEYLLRRAEGEPLAVNLSASRIHTEPEPIGLVVVRDISERRKAQDTLERFFLLSPALFGIVSPGGQLLRGNQAWESVLGYTAEDLKSTPVTDLVHPEDRELAATTIREAGGEMSSREIRCRHKEGSDRWLSWSISRVGDIRYLVALDVTATKEAAALRLAKEAAEVANRARGQFLSSMSHELRTPLTAILALVDVFLADPASRSLPPDRRIDLQAIHRNGEHLLGLINGVLDLARIDAGKVILERSACDPSRIVAEVAEMLRPRSVEKRLGFRVEILSPLPGSIRTDPMRLRQILINLVGNAIKFTDRGEVAIRVEAPSPETLRFTVADTGVGLTEAEIASIFQSFEQVQASRHRSEGGSGLGLAISRRLAEAMEGTLTATGEPGRGSTFELTIPVEILETPHGPECRECSEAGQMDQRPASDAGVSRILLAEDNADNRRAIGLRLEQEGLDVATARDGQEAVDAAMLGEEQGTPFDMILMDMQMPVLDGFEATRQLRQKGYRGQIVALTAFALEEDRLECLRLGCNHHLSKPIEWGKLIDLIQNAAAAPG